jgi:hypothetical protein
VPEYEAKQYEGKLKEGNILISTHVADSDAQKLAKEIFERHHAESISVTTDSGVPKKSKSAGG